MSKQHSNGHKRPINQSTDIYDNGDIRFRKENKLWHRLTDDGPAYKCKGCQREQVITWQELHATIQCLTHHPDQVWSLLCIDGERLALARPGVEIERKKFVCRLVGVILDHGLLTFVS